MDTNLKELHEELLDITSCVADVCEKNNIPYYLAWGSCLGAIRHQNIIPWDDDIDIYVMYRDYRKLKEAFPNGKDDRFFYQDLETDPEYFEGWGKIRENGTTSMDRNLQNIHMHWGICIDLFPLFEYDKPEMDRSTRFKVRIVNALARLPFYTKVAESLPQKAKGMLYRVMGEKCRRKLFFHYLNTLERKGDYMMDVFAYPQNLIFKKEIYGKGKEVPFGKMTAKVPVGYETYLRDVYGEDCMEIPPEGSDKRYYHSNSIVDCHKDFSEYQGKI